MKLIDSSSLYDLILREEFSTLRDAFILDLTAYEFTNVVWKHHTKLKSLSRDECDSLVSEFSKLPLRVIRVSLEDLPQIAKIACETGTTSYDSAYLHFAKKYSLELLTADKSLQKAYEKGR